MNKTLESLEGNVWPSNDLKEKSYLIIACNELRKKPISDFEVEHFRIMIGQNIGLTFLIPEALKVLSEDILAEGDFYEGDLLSSVLTSEPRFWQENVPIWNEVLMLIDNQKDRLKGGLSKKIFEKLSSEIKTFKQHQ